MKPHGGSSSSEPTIRRKDLPPSVTLGWESQSLLVWALAGWALASLLGILLWFHVAARDERAPAATAPEPTVGLSVDAPMDDGPLQQKTALLVPETGVPVVALEELAPSREVTEAEIAPPESTPELKPELKPDSNPDSNNDAVIAAFLRHAAVFTEAGEFDLAIQAYDQAIDHDPGNIDFMILREQVVEMRDTAKHGGTGTGSAGPLAIRESRTEYLPSVSAFDSGRFPETSGGVPSRRATRAPEFPGELVIGLRPRRVEPGDPYVVTVRLYNKGNRVIGVQSVEVLFRADGKLEERGARHAPRVRRVNPRDTALLWERQGVWQEGQVPGGVDVTVHLIDGARVTKTISW